MDSRKQELRQHYRKLRGTGIHQFSWEKLLTDPRFHNARTIASYFSFVDEPETKTLNDAIRASGKILLLPALLPDKNLEWRQWNGEESELVAHGRMYEPRSNQFKGRIDLVIIPALAVDLDGYRLGRGGGSYDRALVHISGWKVCAVYDDEIANSGLPREEHDIRVDTIITPRRIIEIKSK